MPTIWTPERKREYARERYKRLKKEKIGNLIQLESRKSSKENDNNSTQPKILVNPRTVEHKPDSLKISLTGNPFVDTGLAVIAARRNRDSMDDLTLGDLRAVHEDGEWLARNAQQLKCFTMIFTANSLLTQPSIKDKERKIKMHAAITSEFLNLIGNETEDEYCESCGNEKTLNLSTAINNALASFGEEPKERFVGRDWFPLAGSLGSDAQALPSASKAPALCAKCLFAVQYLPLGVRLFGRELAVFQSTNEKFWYKLVINLVNVIRKRIENGVNEIYGSKEGRAGLAKQLLTLFEELQKNKDLFNMESDVKVYAWRFANSTAPNIEIDEIPNHALQFLWKATGLSDEIRSILSKERVLEDYTLFMSIIHRKNYYGLYPGKMGNEKNYEGASHELFCLYQTEILGRTNKSLKAAYEIAKAALQDFETRNTKHVELKKKKSEKTQQKDIQRLTGKKAFQDPKTKSLFRKIMAEQAVQGKFDLQTYIKIFPYTGSSVSVSFSGWDLLRYYFGKAARGSEIEFADEKGNDELSTRPEIFERVNFYASLIYQSYMQKWGKERFEKIILNRLQRGKIDVRWLKSQFCLLARQTYGFTYSDWIRLCYNDESKSVLPELFFQFRLLWSQWLKKPSTEEQIKSKELPSKINSLIDSSELPRNIAESFIKVFDEYVSSRGLRRAEHDILDPLLKGELGLGWFTRNIIRGNFAAVTEEEIDEFLKDEQQNTRIAESTFQMSLFINNVYRLRKANNGAVQKSLGVN